MSTSNSIPVEKPRNSANMFFVHSIMTIQAISVRLTCLFFFPVVLIQRIDLVLDFGEFIIAISITAQQEPRKKLEWAFSMYGMSMMNVRMKKIVSCIH